MEVKFYEDINEFYNLVLPFLLEREAENTLLFSILDAIKRNPTRYGEDKPILIVVRDGNSIIKHVSLRTPPFRLVLAYTDNLDTIAVLAKELLKRNMEIPGVVGFKEGVKIFTQLWCETKNLIHSLIRNERIYQLDKVVEETLGKITFIIGGKSHQPLILEWTKEFILEALSESDDTYIEAGQKRRIDDIKNEKIFLLLDNNEVVSMARKAGKTPNGNLVNLVYTPPKLRKRGYATECVAKLSKYLLEEGNQFCFLFTDLMNPTSNSIYQKIGYRPVIDVDEYQFLPK